MAEKKDNPYVIKGEGGKVAITPAGEEYLSRVVTNTKGQVYAFTEGGSPLLAAAAMARLSRRGSDLREIYLDEFAVAGEEGAEGLIDRVVTEYGDDSVQQLSNVAFVTEGISNLATKKIERGRLRNYLEQSTRYIYYDEKDVAGSYKYFTPRNLPEPLAIEYHKTMDAIFELYSEIVRGTTDYVRKQHPLDDPANKAAWNGATRAQACDAARLVLPTATKSTVGIVCSAQSVEQLVRRLMADSLAEEHDLAEQILAETRKVIGAFLKRADLPERGLAWVKYLQETEEVMKQLAENYLPQESHDFSESVRLEDYYPKDELTLLPKMLFKTGKISQREMRKAIEAWPEERKEEVFAAYMGDRRNRRHKPGRALENLHYDWEITADYGTFRDLQRHRIMDGFEWQNLTTKYGHDVPELVKEAGYETQFRKCFDLSQRLWQEMIDEDFEDEAQYATLLGHKLRYTFTMNSRQAFHFLELRTAPQGHPGYRKICQEMHQKLLAVHPRLGKAMVYINQNADAELTRLESELATQAKLKSLDQEK